ncbi:MAG: lipase family protein [Lachnospiraceae bacterium]|nr:lipase family protein [Lachnospiraceae bacterium]
MKKIKTWHIILTIVLVLTVAAAAVSLFAPEVFKPVKELFTGKDEGAADNSGKAVKDSNQGSSGDTTATVTDPADDGTGDTAATGDNAVGSGEVGSGSYGAEVGGTDLSGYSELFSMYASSMAESVGVESIDLPSSESELSLTLAKEALTLCSGGTKTGQAGVLMNSGFEVLLQSGYDKAADDVSHTCAFSVGRKDIVYRGESRELLVVAIRGTSGSEWFSNFDYADSHSEDSVFAENFLQAAQTINIKLIPVLTAHPDALILVCGHSRGAAAANLLGMTLDDLYGPEGIFVYTFATPNTYRGNDEDAGKYTNIFNFINPADVVTEVPLKAMGYRHIGTDIVLPCEPDAAQRVAEAMQIMAKMSPSIEAYYNDRYSLTGAGAAADGYTAYEIMQALASSLTGIRSDINGRLNLADIYSLMDSSATAGESEFAPLVELLSRIVGKDGSFGVKIFMQHMPATYTALIDAYEQLLAAYGSGGMSGFGQ